MTGRSVLRWMWQNLGSMLLAGVLALTVWMAAVNAEDPIQTRAFPESVPILYQGLPEGLQVVGMPPQEGTVSLRAPRSVWDEISTQEIRLVVDLSGLETGIHTLATTPVVDLQPASVVTRDPQRVTLTLEETLSRRMDVHVIVSGEPEEGYRAEEPQVSPQDAVVTGPTSVLEDVAELAISVDISGLRDDLVLEAELVPLNSEGLEIEGLSVAPATAQVQISILQLGGYRSVAVIPITEGQVEPGFRVTNITVTPTLVTLKSVDPQAVELLPGYVQTEPISLIDATEDISLRVPLSLPEGFTVVGEQSVLVHITIEAIESSVTITRTLEIQGLQANLSAQASPEAVSVILTGPIATLEQLKPEDVRVVLNLFEYGPGVHQVTPEVLLLPMDVQVQTILPESIEVTIIDLILTPTPTP
ncbi:MAG: CdaR family protein [Anaerolineales bacterium]